MIILHHLGLGDNIICNGMVRKICMENPDIHHIFCEPHYYETVSFMYKDLTNLEIHMGKENGRFSFKSCNLNDPNENESFVFAKNNSHLEILMIGYDKMSWFNPDILFDKQFYNHAGMDFNVKWDYFYCDLKSRESEQRQLFDYYKNKYQISENNYIFVHEDPSRGFKLNYDKIPSNFKIVMPEVGLTNNIFDYYMLIKMSSEIHLIDSSFKHVVEAVLQKADYAYLGDSDIPKLFYHTYARGNIHLASSKLAWTRYSER